jgi:hypothetical protein
LSKTLWAICIGIESLEKGHPHWAEEVTRSLLEGHFLATDMTMETFKADTEQGVAEFLEYITQELELVPGNIQNFIGQMLYEIIKLSLWNCPKVQIKVARCRGLAEGFILQPFESPKVSATMTPCWLRRVSSL